MRRFALAAIVLVVASPTRAASVADELELLVTRDQFIAAHPSTSVYRGLDNESLLVQGGGAGNIASVEQAWSDLGNVKLQQQGSMNAAGIAQADGTANSVQATQSGQSNFLNVTQSGAANDATLAQNSDGNRLRLDQQNNLNTANVTQNGYSSVVLQQQGSDRADITLGPGNPLSPFTLTVIQPAGDTVRVTGP